ncbi:mandelate racemase/muconate lactonizing enzyme family protein [Termitidicoccus mucosus]
MKITGIVTRLLKVDASSRYANGHIPAGRPRHWHFPLITLKTDEGVEGHSMAYGPHGDGRGLADLARDSYFPQIKDLDPENGEAIWQKLYKRQRHLYNQTDTMLGVIDVAVWDIRGKIAGRPIAALLGKYREEVPAYMSAKSEFYTETEVAIEAAEAKARGFYGYKLQLRDGAEKDIPRLRAAREAVGKDFRLMQDPNSSYDLTTAITVGRTLDELHYHWYEEPLPETQVGHYRRLAATLKTPILATETSSLGEMAGFLKQEALTIARGDVLIKGGITGLKKAMSMCELFGYNLEIHTANTPLLDVANLHVAASCANTSMMEVHHPAFRFALKKHPFNVERGGLIKAPSAPGLGVELDWAWIDAHTENVRES